MLCRSHTLRFRWVDAVHIVARVSMGDRVELVSMWGSKGVSKRGSIGMSARHLYRCRHRLLVRRGGVGVDELDVEGLSVR